MKISEIISEASRAEKDRQKAAARTQTQDASINWELV